MGGDAQQQLQMSADTVKQAGTRNDSQQPVQQGSARQAANQILRSSAESGGVEEQLSPVRSRLQRLSSNRGLDRAPSVQSSAASLPEQTTGATGQGLQQLQQSPAAQKNSAQPVESDSETGSESGSDIVSESDSEAEAQLVQQEGKPRQSAAVAVRSNRSSQSLDEQSEATRSTRSTEDVAQTKSAALQQKVLKQPLSSDGPASNSMPVSNVPQTASSAQQPAQSQKKRWNVFAK